MVLSDVSEDDKTDVKDVESNVHLPALQGLQRIRSSKKNPLLGFAALPKKEQCAFGLDLIVHYWWYQYLLKMSQQLKYWSQGVKRNFMC